MTRLTELLLEPRYIALVGAICYFCSTGDVEGLFKAIELGRDLVADALVYG